MAEFASLKDNVPVYICKPNLLVKESSINELLPERCEIDQLTLDENVIEKKTTVIKKKETTVFCKMKQLLPIVLVGLLSTGIGFFIGTRVKKE